MSMSDAISLLAFGLVVTACGGSAVGGVATVEEKVHADTAAETVDGSLLADHILHFWDDVDVKDLDGDQKEQMIVDFLYVMGHVDSIVRVGGWECLDSVLASDGPDKLVVEYLGEPGSPLYSPRILEEYLVCMTAGEPAGKHSARRERAAFLLENVRKNSPGEVIADLVLERDGEAVSMREMIKGLAVADNIMLLFYDPDCETCEYLITRLWSAGNRTDTIVAVSVTDRSRPLPSGWISVTVADPDELDDLFWLPSLPSVYIVDSKGIVVAKDIPFGI